MSYYVYMLCDPRKDNLPFYVGKGSGNRCRHHLWETPETTTNRRKHFIISAIEAAGLSVTISIVKQFDDEQAAYDHEARLIETLGRMGYDDDGILTNVCVDNRPPNLKGQTKRTRTPEHCAALSKSLTGRKIPICSDATREKRRQNQLGKKNKATLETRQRISEGLKGRVLSPEHKERIAEAARKRHADRRNSKTPSDHSLGV